MLLSVFLTVYTMPAAMTHICVTTKIIKKMASIDK